MTAHTRPYMLRVKLSLEEQARLEAYGDSKVWSSSHIAREGLNSYLDEHWTDSLSQEAERRLKALEEAYAEERAKKTDKTAS